MRTIERLNEISNKFFKENYVDLKGINKDVVFVHYLDKYAVFVQPKSKSYSKLTNKNLIK